MDEKYLVFTGRPNAGKSSIIREITRLKVASGKQPGTTKRISKYSLSKGLTLVDMPGYGRMTGASKSLEDKVKDQILEFLESNAEYIALAVHVLDISTFREVTQRLEDKGFLSLDVEMIRFLQETLEEHPIVAANKIDKAGADPSHIKRLLLHVNGHLQQIIRNSLRGDRCPFNTIVRNITGVPCLSLIELRGISAVIDVCEVFQDQGKVRSWLCLKLKVPMAVSPVGR